MKKETTECKYIKEEETKKSVEFSIYLQQHWRNSRNCPWIQLQIKCLWGQNPAKENPGQKAELGQTQLWQLMSAKLDAPNVNVIGPRYN